MQAVYRICHISDGHAYIGSAKDIEQRRYWHLTALRGGYHQNVHLQRAWNKYGEQEFVFDVIEEVPGSQEDLLAREQLWLDFYFGLGKAYNIATNAYGGDLGEEWRRLLSIAKGGTGDPRKEKYCVGCGKKISFYATRCQSCYNIHRKGKKLSDEHRQAIREGMATRSPGEIEKWRQNIGATRNKMPKNRCMDCGKNISPGAKRCMSCRSKNPEWLWAIGKGQKRSEQIKYNIGRAQRKRRRRERLSEAGKIDD